MSRNLHLDDCVCGKCEDARNAPHPDTARADAAERILAGVMETLGSEPDPLRLFGIVYHKTPGLREWWEPRCEERFRESRLADLTARRDRERAALEATERELEGLTR